MKYTYKICRLSAHCCVTRNLHCIILGVSISQFLCHFLCFTDHFSGLSVGVGVDQRSILRKSPRVTKALTREFVNKRVRGGGRPFPELNDMKARHFVLAIFASVLCLCQGYTLRSSVSWVVSSNDVVEDADLSEEVAPALLVDGAALWKQAYPSSSVLGDSVESPGELVKPEDENVAQLSSRLFSYRLEKVKKSTGSSPPPHQETARTARYIAHYSDWGHLSTISTQDKVTHTERRWCFGGGGAPGPDSNPICWCSLGLAFHVHV